MKQIRIDQIENGYLVVTPKPINKLTFAQAQVDPGTQPANVHYCANMSEVCDYLSKLD